MNNTGPGRPKTIEGKLVNFNTKIVEDQKRILEAIAEVGPFGSYREMLEAWTTDYLAKNPHLAEKVKSYMDIMKG